MRFHQCVPCAFLADLVGGSASNHRERTLRAAFTDRSCMTSATHARHSCIYCIAFIFHHSLHSVIHRSTRALPCGSRIALYSYIRHRVEDSSGSHHVHARSRSLLCWDNTHIFVHCLHRIVYLTRYHGDSHCDGVPVSLRVSRIEQTLQCAPRRIVVVCSTFFLSDDQSLVSFLPFGLFLIPFSPQPVHDYVGH